MPNVAQVLKLEMKRIAAKELRASGLGSRVKALGQQVRALRKRIKALEARPTAVKAKAQSAAGKAFEPTPASLKSLRARLGLTQPGLAKAIRVSASAVTKWETGKMRPGAKASRALQRLAGQMAEQPSEQPHAAQTRRGRRFKATPAVVKRIRAKLDVTQAELAKLLGVSHSAVYQWEADRIAPRPKATVALQALEGIGKREARRRLEAR